MVRRGPLKTLDCGPYKGMAIDTLIRTNTRYFMSCVKEWLDISPSQARTFTLVTSGGEIPPRYIKEFPSQEKTTPTDLDWTSRDRMLYNENLDILPNYDFDPSTAPEWWEEFKRRSAGFTRPSQIVNLYESYVKKDLQKSLEMICRDTR